MSNKYEIKQNGVLLNTIMATEEFVNSNFPSELYEVTRRYTASEVRKERDVLLVDMDAELSNPIRWAELDAPTKALWTTYRTALLEVPQQAGFPDTVTWPTKP